MLGSRAAELTREHVTAFGIGCPIDRLCAEAGGKVLLLGVGHVASSMLHVAESHARVPKKCKHGEPPPQIEMRDEGVVLGYHALDATVSCSAGFDAAAAALRAAGLVRDAKVGDCLIQLITPAADAIATVAAGLRADATRLLCTDEACVSCAATRGLLDARTAA